MTGSHRSALRPAVLTILALAFLLATGGAAGMVPVAANALPATATGTPTPTATPTIPLTVVPVPVERPADLTEAEVVEVIDGDTIRVRIGDQESTVRYIGIDAPETDEEEPLADKATEVNRALVGGKTVGLDQDVSETDPYGRLLRYVWAGDLMVNAELVRLGLAEATPYPPDTRYEDLFSDLQTEARKETIGVWQPGLQPSEPPGTEEPEPTITEPATNCDPAYPDVCIPPPPPDLDCDDIPQRNFRVLPPDPHHFDRDGDGIGCEG